MTTIANTNSNTNSTSAPVLQVKTTFADETRRFHLADPAPTVDKLIAEVKAVHGIPSGALVQLRYKDDEDDLITVTRDVELAEAIRVAEGAPLRLVVSVAVAQPSVTPVPTNVVPTTNLVPIPVPAASSSSIAARPSAAPRASEATPGAPAQVSLTPGWQGLPQQATTSDAQSAKEAWKAWKAEKQRMRHEQQHQAWFHHREALRARVQHFRERSAEAQNDKVERVHGLKEELHRVKTELREARKEFMHMPREGIMAARFVRDVSVPDGTQVEAGAAFIKTWRFRNESPRPWPEGTRLLFVGKNSDRLGAPDEVVVSPAALPGQEVDISVPLVAPMQSGRFCAYFRLAGPAGKKFGQRVWCSIAVGGDSSSSDEKSGPVRDEDLLKYKHQLEVLAELNETCIRRNVRMLAKHNGNLEPVVEKLLKRRQRFEKRCNGLERKIEKNICKAEEKVDKKIAKAESRLQS